MQYLIIINISCEVEAGLQAEHTFHGGYLVKTIASFLIFGVILLFVKRCTTIVLVRIVKQCSFIEVQPHCSRKIINETKRHVIFAQFLEKYHGRKSGTVGHRVPYLNKMTLNYS